MNCGVSLFKGCHLQTPLMSSPEPALTLASAFYIFQVLGYKEAARVYETPRDETFTWGRETFTPFIQLQSTPTPQKLLVKPVTSSYLRTRAQLGC